jgi:hypothetical protein
MGPRDFMRFVGRRSRSHWPMLAVVSVGVVAAVVTIAASVIYFDSLGDIALTREIANDRVGSHDIVISGRETDIDAASNRRILELVETSVDEFASPIITDLTLAYGSMTLMVEQAKSHDTELDDSLRAVLINAPELRGNSILTAGSWPSAIAGENEPGQLLIDVALEESAAGLLDLVVGDTVVVAPFWDDLNDSIAVRISGTFARSGADPNFWSEVADKFFLDDPDLNFLPLIPDPGVFESVVGPYLPGMAVRYFWRFHVDSSRVNASGANKLLLGFDKLKAELQPKISSYSQKIPLQSLLERNQQQTFFSRLPMTVVFSVIAAVVLYFVGTMSILMVETQRDDIARLRTRAATVRQVVGAFVIEGAVVALLAILLAPPIAALVVKWLGVIPVFSGLNGGDPLPVSLGQAAYVVSILAGLAGFLAMVIPASLAAKRTVVSSVRESTRPSPQGAMQKYYLDIVLFGLLLLFASQLTSDGSFVDVPGVGAAQVDKLNVAMPALVLAFGGFVALRAFPSMVEVVARLTSLPRISGLVSPAVSLVLWQMARNPRHYSRLSLLMILTAGLGVFASSFAGTLDVSASDRARYQSGSDLRVNGISYTNRVKTAGMFRSIAGTSGVELAAPAFRTVGVDLTADVGSTFTYLGVDPEPMVDIAWVREDFASISLADQMELLAGSRTGIAIPEDAVFVTAKVRPTARRADSRVAARLSDSTGRLFTLNLGSLLPRSAAKMTSVKDINRVFLDIIGPGDGASPLHMAVLISNKEIVGLLLDKGADIDIKANDADAGTPLHWAVYSGNREMAELLIERGADFNAENKAGYRPIDFASEGFVRPEWFDRENTDLALATAGTEANASSSFLKIDPTSRIYTLQSLLDVGFKRNKTYSVVNLDSAIEAHHGFFGLDPYNRLEYEARFYPTHAEASDVGVDFAEEVIGEDAVSEELQRWQEGLGERRQCTTRGRRWPPDCDNPKYFDYIVVGNMVLLCQGEDSSTSIQACVDLIESVRPIAKINDTDRIYTAYDIKGATNFKLDDDYDIEGLDAAVAAIYGFYGSDPYNRLEYEVRFYADHATATSIGVDFADEATGDNAVILKDVQRWDEGLKDRRQCAGDGGHHSGKCDNPKYFDYVVVGNMIMLCQGKSTAESHQACADLMQSVEEVKVSPIGGQITESDGRDTIADAPRDGVAAQHQFKVVISSEDEEIFAAILESDTDAVNRYLELNSCDVAEAHLPPNWCTIAGSLDSIDFTGVNPIPPLRLEFIGVGLPNVERGRFSRANPPFLDPGSVEIDELGIVLESGETRVIEEFNEDSSWMTVEPGLNQYGARLAPLLTIEEDGSEGEDQGIAVMFWNPVLITRLRGVTVGSVNAPIPVIASTHYMDRSGFEVGERVTVDIQGKRVPVRLAGVADYFPTLDPEFSSFVVGDIRSTWMALNADRMRSAEPVNEVWIDTGEAAPSDVGNELRRRSQFPPSLIAQDQLLHDAAVDPLISAGWRALLVIAFATVLAASAVGFLVYSQVTFASRMTEYAVVRTLGLTTRQILGLVTLELLMVLVPAVLVGGVLGMRMGETIIPFLVTSGEGVRVVPPVVLNVDWQTVGVLVGVLGAIFLAISIGLISSVRKISPPRVMRMGQN